MVFNKHIVITIIQLTWNTDTNIAIRVRRKNNRKCSQAKHSAPPPPKLTERMSSQLSTNGQITYLLLWQVWHNIQYRVDTCLECVSSFMSLRQRDEEIRPKGSLSRYFLNKSTIHVWHWQDWRNFSTNPTKPCYLARSRNRCCHNFRKRERVPLHNDQPQVCILVRIYFPLTALSSSSCKWHRQDAKIRLIH